MAHGGYFGGLALIRGIKELSKKMGHKMIIATVLLGVVLMITGTCLTTEIGGILFLIGLLLTVIGVGAAFTQRFEDMSESSKKIARFIALLIIIALISVCIFLLVRLH